MKTSSFSSNQWESTQLTNILKEKAYPTSKWVKICFNSVNLDTDLLSSFLPKSSSTKPVRIITFSSPNTVKTLFKMIVLCSTLQKYSMCRIGAINFKKKVRKDKSLAEPTFSTIFVCVLKFLLLMILCSTSTPFKQY